MRAKSNSHNLMMGYGPSEMEDLMEVLNIKANMSRKRRNKKARVCAGSHDNEVEGGEESEVRIKTREEVNEIFK